MAYQVRHPAAFINAIAEEGTKAEAVEWLQRTWDDYCDALQTIKKIQEDASNRERRLIQN